MKNDYMCPHCRGFLNVDHNICFSVKSKFGTSGLVFLNPDVGNYTHLKHALFAVKEGDFLDFFCPICNTSLESKELDSNLGTILLFDQQDKTEYEILFSKVYGERCTYKKKGSRIIPFGEHQSKYLGLLNVGNF